MRLGKAKRRGRRMQESARRAKNQMNGGRQAATRLYRNSSGAAAIMTALLFPVFVGFTGLAVDVGMWYHDKRAMQTAVDAAALAGAHELVKDNSNNQTVNGTVEEAAADDAVLNGYDPADTVEFTVNIASNRESVEVIMRQESPLYFSSLFLTEPVTIYTRAVAGLALAQQEACILALDPNSRDAIRLDSNSEINVIGCAIQVNSRNPAALQAFSNSSVTATSICVNGGFLDHTGGSGGFSPAPQTGCDTVADPLANREPPPFSENCEFNDTVVDNTSASLPGGVYCGGVLVKGNSTVTLRPGTYIGGIEVDSNSTVSLEPGEYIVKDGKLHIKSNSTIAGDGVGIYLTGEGATFDFDSNTEVDLSAPISGPLEGLVFFQDRNVPVMETHIINSNSKISFEGTLYFPNGKLEVDSNGLSQGTAPWTKIVARQFELDSNGVLELNSDYDSSNVPVPPGIITSSRSGVTLIE